MTKDEATKVMMDVALQRKPHTRAAIQIATAVLDPPMKKGLDPTDAAHRAKAASAARVQAEARVARADADADAAMARAKDANERLNAIDKPAPVTKAAVAEVT